MSVAYSYSRALFEAAVAQKASSDLLDQIENEMDGVISVMETSKDLSNALLAPVITVREKISLVEPLAKKLNLSQLFEQFLVLLARKGRLSMLKEIRESFSSVRLAQEGGLAGRLVSAEPMSETDIGTLSQAFSHKLGKKVAFRVSTDPSLLAGMKVTVNGVTYDGTLRSQLQKLRDRFVVGVSAAHA